MSYQVLARKWRPRKFQDVIGQEAITRSLQNAIKRSRLGHAYLFTGTRGIGKTSVARLFAQAIRCEALTPDGNPCDHCPACMDMLEQNSMNVIEIDGASNNGVDEIRELINNVQYLPTSGNYKVYIIDEVHMLSKPAFNALLKTLEEPPKHVVFLLATTEPNKLLGTVLSRCQRFDFVNASVELLASHLHRIAEAEGIIFESDEQMRDIARLGNGSFRDTLSLLDQVLSYTSNNRVSEEVLSQSLGVVRRELLDQITAAVLRGDGDVAVAGCKQALTENIALKSLFTAVLDNVFNLIEHIDDSAWLEKREALAQTVGQVTTAELFWVYESLARESSWVLEAIVPEQTFYVLIKKLALRRQLLGLEEAAVTTVAAKKKVVEPPTPKPQPEIKIEIKEEAKVEPKPEARPEPEIEVAPVIVPTGSSIEDFIKYLEKVAPTLAASLEHAELSPAELASSHSLSIRYPLGGEVFHDVIVEENNRKRLQKYADEFCKKEVTIEIEIAREGVRTRAQERKEQDLLDEEERRKEILADPMLQMAQEMFNSKIDKIQLGKKGD